MAQITLYVDVTANRLIAALNSSQVVEPNSIPLSLGDTVQIQVYLMTRLPNQNPNIFPYSIMLTNGLSLQMFITDGTPSGTIYTQQIVWQTDPNNQFFYANLALNTAPLVTLFGTANTATAFLLIGYIAGGLPTTVLDRQIKMTVGIPGNPLVVPAGLTPLSAEVANATYFPINPTPGQTLYLVSPMGKIMALRAVDQDGTAVAQWANIN